MMDPAVKTAMALCIVLGGVCAALLFRSDPTPSPQGVSSPADPLHIRRGVEDRNAGNSSAATPERASGGKTAPRGLEAVSVLKPIDDRFAPPAWQDGSFRTEGRAAPGGRPSPYAVLPSAAFDAPTPRTHRIVDGDTLAGLAERYLGHPSRAGELFEANRGVLSSPELLPIGAELVIPPRDPPSGRPKVPGSDMLPTPPLVPVR